MHTFPFNPNLLNRWEQPHYSVEQTKPSASGHPISAFATSANGGEYRKSFHGYPPGYALVVDSATSVQTSPMQIDTWNRDEMDISRNGDVKFVPGPLPAASQVLCVCVCVSVCVCVCWLCICVWVVVVLYAYNYVLSCVYIPH